MSSEKYDHIILVLFQVCTSMGMVSQKNSCAVYWIFAEGPILLIEELGECLNAKF